MNHPMQGSAADIIKLAMRQVQRAPAWKRASRPGLLVQVHDELDFSVPDGEVEALSAMVRDVMEHVAELKVPLLADISAADTWAEAHLACGHSVKRGGDAEKAGNAAACVHNIWYHIECCARGGAAEISAMIRGDCAFDHFVDLLRSRC